VARRCSCSPKDAQLLLGNGDDAGRRGHSLAELLQQANHGEGIKLTVSEQLMPHLRNPLGIGLTAKGDERSGSAGSVPDVEICV